YFGTQHRNGTVYALDLHRGRRVWRQRAESPAAAQPAYADGRLYLPTTEDVQAFAVDDGQPLWRLPLDGATVQPPIVLDDDVLVAAGDTLLRIGSADGELRSRTPLPGRPSAPLALRGDTVVISMHPGIVAAYVDGGAREVWRHEVDAPVLAAPVLTDDGVFILTRSATLYRINGRSLQRTAELGGAATESLTITADGALVGTLDGRLVYLRRDGSTAWEQKLDGSIRAPAVVHEGDVYAGTLKGRLVKLTSG
ncbi:MAG TPA: PQQ-binding-like beta-propeller repeat protein, partial [Longimicrobiales bacterium]|nr:PQQ-binding-like beta-propeller repeat protein [Longimicrobiales bacterium]